MFLVVTSVTFLTVVTFIAIVTAVMSFTCVIQAVLRGVAALECARAKIAVDLTVPTDRQLSDRRPDLILYLKGERKIVILEGAVA